MCSFALLPVQVQCGDIELEKKIDEKIEQFVSWVEKHPNKKSQVSNSLMIYSYTVYVIIHDAYCEAC